jgi:NAD+ synthase (glutamine-hydrolysing)
MSSEFGFVKTATGSFEVVVGNPDANKEKILSLIKTGIKENVDILVLPELALTGYTCGDLFMQPYLTGFSEKALQEILDETGREKSGMITILGLPLRQRGMLFNAAVIIQGNKILGVVPKSYLPNYSEYHEKRWFSPASARISDTIMICKNEVPFSTDLIVETPSGIRLACEICEDLWVNNPPSSFHTLYGANIIVNPSASNEFATKSRYRRDLVKMQSARCNCGYVYASSGLGESTTDLVFSGHNIISYNGVIMAEEKEKSGLMTSVIDIEKLENDRIRFNSFVQKIDDSGRGRNYTFVKANDTSSEDVFPDKINPTPFVPDEEGKEERCREILHLQARGLAQRLKNTGIKKTVIGISGGLDSTLALLVAADAYEMAGLPLKNIIGITMPGFGTSDRTKSNSEKLMELMGVTIRRIDIKKSCLKHMEDIGHDPKCYDVTYENVQARERTQILMDLANKENGLVIGTGDLSELALGWCTYNGDHMSMYAVNSGVPKTLVKYLVSAYGDMHPDLKDVLTSVCETTISPELLPVESGDEIQSTEDTIGKYVLHDFFLYHFVRNGFTKEKIQKLAYIAFKETEYEKEIDKTLETFFSRFFSQQFKRSCLPDGPKVGTVSLSPRGDWRMPSDMRYPYQDN